MKIIKSPDKHKKVKEKTNKNDFKINFINEHKNENQHQYTNSDITISSSLLNKIKVCIKKIGIYHHINSMKKQIYQNHKYPQ